MTLPNWISDGLGIEIRGSDDWLWRKQDLEKAIDIVLAALACAHKPRCVGVLLDNGPRWLAIDLASQCTDITIVPLPAFFTPSQLTHIISAACIDVLFCDDAAQARMLGFGAVVFDDADFHLFQRDATARHDDGDRCRAQSQKITFTSGTTGAPKGVCLNTAQQLGVARALAAAIAPLNIARHLVLLPLPVLLENVAGVYTPMLLGAQCICVPLSDVGMAGSSGFDARRCLDAIGRHAAESVILLPQMLHAIVARLEGCLQEQALVRTLKFVAVGGGKTPAPLIRRARDLGVPVYEGYGLSECASVVSLNVPGADKPGTVGRALPGTILRVAADGELEVSGRPIGGYLGQEAHTETWLRTGDIGSVDADGYVSISGRKKNMLITSFGRNVSPEWPENLLLESPLVAQCVVVGDARPHLVAMLVATSDHVTDRELGEVVGVVNQKLPDYARVRAWIRAPESFTSRNGLATPNGRVRREVLWDRYAERLNALYGTESS